MTHQPPSDELPPSRGPYPVQHTPDELDALYGHAPQDEPSEAGRVRLLSPLRLLLLLVVIGASGAVFFALFISPQLALAVSSLAVLGVALAIFALSLAGAAAGFGRQGDGGRAVLVALFGGLCAFGAAGSLGGAIVLGILAAGA